MNPIQSSEHLADLIARAKDGADAYCTNLFASPKRLDRWIESGGLLGHQHEGTIFLFRRDRDFWHLYFCSRNPEVLERALAAGAQRPHEPMVVDLVGHRDALEPLAAVWARHGFRHYNRLYRMSRGTVTAISKVSEERNRVVHAQPADCRSILELLWTTFDPRAEQLPDAGEIGEAVEAKQILITPREGTCGGLLFFESQGLTSTVRYWLVADTCRSLGFGSALMQYYFAAHPQVRRFILWVISTNENAIQKYHHYGFAPDGLVDFVMISDGITS